MASSQCFASGPRLDYMSIHPMICPWTSFCRRRLIMTKFIRSMLAVAAVLAATPAMAEIMHVGGSPHDKPGRGQPDGDL